MLSPASLQAKDKCSCIAGLKSVASLNLVYHVFNRRLGIPILLILSLKGLCYFSLQGHLG